MKMRGIILTGDSVPSIFDGKKTQTRRLMPSQPEEPVDLWRTDGHGHWYGVAKLDSSDGIGVPVTGIERARYRVGEHLFIKERWRNFGGREYEYQKERGAVIYAADADGGDLGPWNSSMFMPRWASRGVIEVVDTRAEQLMAISEQDARAEGTKPFPNDPEGDCWTDGTLRTAFEYQWNELHGWKPNAFQRNPAVWVYTFKLVEDLR